MTLQLLARRIKPLWDRVLVKKFVPPKTTTGGILLPDSAQTDDVPQGEIVATGPGAQDKDGKTLPMTLKVGQSVLLPQYGGQNLEIESEV